MIELDLIKLPVNPRKFLPAQVAKLLDHYSVYVRSGGARDLHDYLITACKMIFDAMSESDQQYYGNYSRFFTLFVGEVGMEVALDLMNRAGTWEGRRQQYTKV